MSAYEPYHHLGKAKAKSCTPRKSSKAKPDTETSSLFHFRSKCGSGSFSASSVWPLRCGSACPRHKRFPRCSALERNHVAVNFFLERVWRSPCKSGGYKTNSQEVKITTQNGKKKKERKKNVTWFYASHLLPPRGIERCRLPWLRRGSDGWKCEFAVGNTPAPGPLCKTLISAQDGKGKRQVSRGPRSSSPAEGWPAQQLM